MLRENEIMKDLQDVLLVRGRRSDTFHMLTSTQICCYYPSAKPEYHSEMSFHQHLWRLPTENHDPMPHRAEAKNACIRVQDLSALLDRAVQRRRDRFSCEVS